MMLALRYEIPGEQQKVLLCESLQRFLQNFKQTEPQDKESGGQLFAQLSTLGDIVICHATGPAVNDRASIVSFIIDKTRCNQEIKKLFKRGFHYVGDWHTHPESSPCPSGTDIHSMQELFCKSKHQHNSFLMLILGINEGPDGIWLSQHNQTEYRRLSYVDEVEHHCPNTFDHRFRKRK